MLLTIKYPRLPTLIEGVNTTAKNIILFDKKKGTKPIDYFDFRNIAGRSGRMKQHFIGHVYKFEDAPEQLDLHVDFPILTQVNAPTELLMAIDEADLKAEGKARIQSYDGLEAELKEIVRQNPSVPLDGQLKIVDLIKQNQTAWYPVLGICPLFLPLLPEYIPEFQKLGRCREQ